MPSATPTAVSAIADTLSTPRFATYVSACHGDQQRAAALYGWNARVSAALMVPAHFAEVATRNAVDDALSTAYGARWPWNPTFEQSLPAPRQGYNPRRDLTMCRQQQPTTGKIIAELKFVFWQKMFTARHDIRLWNPSISALFPTAPTGLPAAQLRQRIYDDLEVIRRVRNRIAHHEPIFTRNLIDDLERMLDLIDLRSPATGTWVRAMEDATQVLTERP